jgi:hypothetical protein
MPYDTDCRPFHMVFLIWERCMPEENKNKKVFWGSGGSCGDWKANRKPTGSFASGMMFGIAIGIMIGLILGLSR